MATCHRLLATPDIEAAVRVGDVYALLTEWHFSKQEHELALKMIQGMQVCECVCVWCLCVCLWCVGLCLCVCLCVYVCVFCMHDALPAEETHRHRALSRRCNGESRDRCDL